MFKPLGKLDLDMEKLGVRNSDAIILREVSCLVLKNPMAHARISLKKA
ncbi:MAG: hypothetical protein HUK08_09245 [Bacteroidaceae bacterium]|nr:hypothetical protein [Bacteroidaceae bacterium]